MIINKLSMVLLVGILTACSSKMDVLPVLNGKIREPINAVIYDTPPLVVTTIPEMASPKIVQPYSQERSKPRRVSVPTKPNISNVTPVNIENNTEVVSTQTIEAVSPTNVSVTEPAIAIPVVAVQENANLENKVASPSVQAPIKLPAARIFEPNEATSSKLSVLPTEVTIESKSSETSTPEVVTLAPIKLSSSQVNPIEVAPDSDTATPLDKKEEVANDTVTMPQSNTKEAP